MSVEYIVESDVIIRAVDKPFPDRQFMGSFPTSEMAYAYVEKYLADTKDLHTYFTRQFLSSNTELEERIKQNKDKKNVCSEKELIYKELNNIFGESGVKKSIISNIFVFINNLVYLKISQQYRGNCNLEFWNIFYKIHASLLNRSNNSVCFSFFNGDIFITKSKRRF